MQSGAGTEAAFSDAAYTDAGATVAPDAAATVSGAGSGRPGQPTERRRGGRPAAGRHRPELLRRGAVRGRAARAGGQGRHRLQLRPAAPDQPGPVHGRPQLAGHRVGLPGRPGRGRAPGQVLPHVHDGGGHRAPGQGAGDGRRRGRPAGHRHGPAARRRGPGLRRAGRRQGGGPRASGATFVELGARDPGGRRRLRPRAVAPRSSTASRSCWPPRSAASDVVITTAADPRPQGAGAGDRRRWSRGWPRAPSSSTWPPTRAATASCPRPARTCVDHGACTVVGLANPPSGMPTHASFLYARNIANFSGLWSRTGELAPDFDDEIVAGMCVLREGAAMAPAGRRAARLGRRRTGDRSDRTVVIAPILQSAPDGGRRHRPPASSST